MKIIEDKTKYENIKKVREMMDFFDHDEEFDLIFSKLRELKISIFLALVILYAVVGCFIYLYLTGRWTNIPLIQKTECLGLLFVTAASFWVFILHRQKLRKSDVMTRYTARDIFIYWLMTGKTAKSARISSNRKYVYIQKEHEITKLPIEGFAFEGKGNNVNTINLDNMVMVLGDEG